jgi:hypothetical protein
MSGYTGPVIALTHHDAQTILPHLNDKPDAAPVVAKLRAALESDPAWRQPLR